nr:unnamed protein product [Digitaria exilis]
MEMVAFDTVSEKFHVMAGPPAAAPVRMKMFAMDGLLVAANLGDARQYGSCVYNVRAWMSWAVSYVATPDNGVLMSRHVFRESLVQHPGFQAWSSSADLPLIRFGC